MANDDPWGSETAAADPWGSGGGGASGDAADDTDINENSKGGDNTCFVCKEEVSLEAYHKMIRFLIVMKNTFLGSHVEGLPAEGSYEVLQLRRRGTL